MGFHLPALPTLERIMNTITEGDFMLRSVSFYFLFHSFTNTHFFFYHFEALKHQCIDHFNLDTQPTSLETTTTSSFYFLLWHLPRDH